MAKQFDAVVIGAGPGGYPCAIRLAQLGIKTAIVEREFLGGVCLNVGCIPSKALIHAAKQYHNAVHENAEMGIVAKNVELDLKQMQVWKSGVVKKLTGGVGQLLKMNGVEVITGSAVFKDAKTIQVGSETVTAKHFVVATGSRIIELPFLPFNGKNVLNSTQALDMDWLPKRTIVIGGGYIGLELGMVVAKMGSEVTVVEMTDGLLQGVDRELVQVVEKKMRKLGMTTHFQTKALGLKEKEPAKSSVLHLEVEGGGKKQTLEAECILVSVGRKPNSDGMNLEKLGVKIEKGNIETNSKGQTNVPGIWAIGDVTGFPQLAHRATMDGLLVAAAIAGQNSHKDYKTVPYAVFTDPEIAACGLTETEAKAKGLKYRVGKFPFAASGRALSTNESDGFIKVIVDETNEMLLGVHIVGPEASNLIAEATLAIEMGACAEDIERTIHTHPTLPEAFPEAIELAFNKAIHVFKPAAGKTNVRRPEAST